MTKPELEQQIKALEQTIAEQAQAIAEFGALSDRAAELEGIVFDQQQTIAALQIKLAKTMQPSAFVELAKGWMKSAIGKRAADNPKIDLTGFDMGVRERDFESIQIAYGNILATLKADGQPATVKEQQEIGILLKTLGFA
jgi:uncharacterized coiled-coil protein SlyX